MEARLQSRRRRERAGDIWSATYILLGLRYSQALARQLLRRVRSMKESVTYQAILEEGEAIGLAKGEAKGRSEGALAEAKKMLLRQGRVRFGSPRPAIAEALEQIRDVGRLEEFGERILGAASWEELLGLPAPRRPHARRRPKA